MHATQHAAIAEPAAVGVEFADVQREAAGALADGAVTPDERRALDAELEDLVQRAHGLRLALGATRRKPLARATTRAVLLLGALLATTACATGTPTVSRTTAGWLDDRPVVEVVATSDVDLIERECAQGRAEAEAEGHAVGTVLGCRLARVVLRAGTMIVKAVRVVRWTDAVPGEAAAYIEAHEWCHVVELLAGLGAVCHARGERTLDVALRARRTRSRRTRRDDDDDTWESLDDVLRPPVPTGRAATR